MRYNSGQQRPLIHYTVVNKRQSVYTVITWQVLAYTSIIKIEITIYNRIWETFIKYT